MDEFEIIQRFWKPLGQEGAPGIVRGIGDDCAELMVPVGQNLIQSIDTLVSGVHFLPDICPADLGWRALAVSASDLAAAGAQPWSASLAITLPKPVRSEWLEAFSGGLGEACRAFRLPLIGGDSTAGPLTLTLHVQGLCPPGQTLIRAGASPGDLICVSGYLGDAGEALRWLQDQSDAPSILAVRSRYLRPTPRLELGMALRQRASACIDLSDGLLSDLGHILTASNAGASLDLGAIPISAALRELAPERALELALTAGDDYELCFTWPANRGDPTRFAATGVPISVIGEIEPVAGIRFRNSPAGWTLPAVSGYRHFSEIG